MITVKVPATTANVGPGFDTLGMALNLYNLYRFKKTGEGVVLKGVEDAYNNEDNIIVQSIKETFAYCGEPLFGMEVTVESEIPVSRGLGSSAACIIGGILGAAEMLGRKLTHQEVLAIALKIEGHPDNITPALVGGMTIAFNVDASIEYLKLDIVDQYAYYVFIPPFKTSTEEARRILPDMVPMGDAVYNVSRSSLLIASLLSGKQQFLSRALEDRLHQQFRGQLIQGFEDLKEILVDPPFLGQFISGSGPTVIGMTEKDYTGMPEFRDWTILRLGLDSEGARVIAG